MKALFLKELKELTWLGAPLAILWCLAWAVVPPIRNLLGPGGQTLELTAYGSIVIGLLLGLAPFEFERRSGMRFFLVHRGMSSRAVACTRIAAAGTWVAMVLTLGVIVVAVLHLWPARQVPGLVQHALSALAMSMAIAFPALALGSFAGCLGERAWLRLSALILSGLGLLYIGGALSRFEVLSSRFGIVPYAAFSASAFATGAWIAVERFRSGTCEDRPLGVGASIGSGVLGAALWTPALLLIVVPLQLAARARSWGSNAVWVQSADGRLMPRNPNALPETTVTQWITFRPSSTVRLARDEVLVFHPVGGSSILAQGMLGSGRRWSGPREWSFGVREFINPQSTIEGVSTVWIDRQIGMLVQRTWPMFGRAEFEAFQLPAGLDDAGTPRLERGRALNSYSKFAVVVDGAGRPRAVLDLPPLAMNYRPIEFPSSDRLMSRLPVFEIALEEEPTESIPFTDDLFLGERGGYVFDGDLFLPVARYEPVKFTHYESRSNCRVAVSDYDGLAYRISIYDEASGAMAASSRIAPGTAWETGCSWIAKVATCLRPPVATVAASTWVHSDDDGMQTPARSLWIDPLVLGGRRPWLVALHVGVAAALAWATRRRLGERAWGWPLAVLALGVPAWLVCLLLEPRRAARAMAVEPRARAAWAPIVDRASA